MFWTVLLWIVLSLLALFLLVLLLPAVLYVDYREEELVVKLRVLVFKFTVFPLKERRVTPGKKEKEEKKRQEKKPRKKRSIEQWVHLVKRFAASGKAGMRFLLRHMSFRGITLVLPVHEEDAAQTALQTGRMQALIGSARAVLENILRLSYKALIVMPDFTGQMSGGIVFSCKIVAAPVIMLATGVIAFKTFLSYGRRPQAKAAPAQGTASGTATKNQQTVSAAPITDEQQRKEA